MCYWYQSVFHHWQSIHKNSLGDEGFISAHGFKGFGLCSSHCIAFGPKVKRNIKIGSPWKKLDVPWHREEVKGNIPLKDMPTVAPLPCFCTSQLLWNECHRPHSVLPQSPTLITVLGAQPLTHYLVWNVGNSNSNTILMNSTRGKLPLGKTQVVLRCNCGWEWPLYLDIAQIEEYQIQDTAVWHAMESVVPTHKATIKLCTIRFEIFRLLKFIHSWV